jgi:anhydro-N-acetylmuramic acid kinase
MKRGVRTENLVHTLARWTAWSIADAYLHFLPELPGEVIVCGGGADNPVLMEMLAEELGVLRSDYGVNAPAVRRIEEFGIPNKAKEAASFALLGAATLDGVAGNVPTVTGAERLVVLGVVARP